MRIASIICSIVSWVTLAVAVFFQLLLIVVFGIPSLLGRATEGRLMAAQVTNTLPILVTGFVLFLAGFFLFRYMRRGRWIWFAFLVIGAVALAGVGLYFNSIQQTTILSDGTIAGITSEELIIRHFSPAFTAVFHLLAVLFGGFADDKALRTEAIKEIKKRGVKPKYE